MAKEDTQPAQGMMGPRSRLGMGIHDSNPGYQLMVKQGWEVGKGLGQKLQGKVDPHLPACQPFDPERSKEGLGMARYKEVLHGQEAEDQLRVCSCSQAVLSNANLLRICFLLAGQHCQSSLV